MNRRTVRGLLPAIAALAVTLAAPGCFDGEKKGGGPAVRDDVYVTGSGATRILVTGDTAYVIAFGDNVVDVVDLHTCTGEASSCERVARAQLETGSSPFAGAIENGDAWVNESGANRIVRIDAAGTVVAVVTTGSGAFAEPQDVAVAANGKKFVANANGYGFGGPGFVSVVQGTAITASITTTQLQPVGFATLPDGDLALTNLGFVDFSGSTPVVTSSGGIDIIDTSTNTVTRNIDLGLTAPVGRPALTADASYGFVPSGTGGIVMRVTMADGTIDEIDLGPDASFITWTLVEGNHLFVLSYGEDRVYVYDVNSLAPVDLGDGDDFITVGPGGATAKGPVHAAVWEHHGERHLLVVLSAANSVTDVLLDELLP